MTGRAVKVAVSLAPGDFRRVERVRKELRLSRSAAIAEALKCWFSAGRKEEMVRAYVEGYRSQPETAAETKTFESLAAGTLAGEEWES